LFEAGSERSAAGKPRSGKFWPFHFEKYFWSHAGCACKVEWGDFRQAKFFENSHLPGHIVTYGYWDAGGECRS
jgi:hypothetical protein